MLLSLDTCSSVSLEFLPSRSFLASERYGTEDSDCEAGWNRQAIAVVTITYLFLDPNAQFLVLLQSESEHAARM
jgi:hypothetical protein